MASLAPHRGRVELAEEASGECFLLHQLTGELVRLPEPVRLRYNDAGFGYVAKKPAVAGVAPTWVSDCVAVQIYEAPEEAGSDYVATYRDKEGGEMKKYAGRRKIAAVCAAVAGVSGDGGEVRQGLGEREGGGRGDSGRTA